MCGRYACITPANVFAERFGVTFAGGLVPRYNLAPTQASLLARNAPWAGGGREMVTLRWGLVPSWAKDLSIGNKLINARSETVHTAPTFRKAFAQRRCLIAADGFYEWGKPAGGPKQPWFFRLAGGEPFGFAGLWARWQGPEGTVDSCTILTTEANETVAPVHGRMPVIVAPADYDRWLDPGVRERADLEDILRPYSADQTEGWPDGFEGKLTTAKWAKIAKCPQDTAHRDIVDLIERGALREDPGAGRSPSYSLVLEGAS